MIERPGATMSGFLVPVVPPDPLEEKLATWSSLVDRVFIESVAPTLST
jgi:hypothetical protein